MQKTLYFTLFALLIFFGRLQAQQDPQFSQYMYNQAYLNPAAVGYEGVTRFQLIHRQQYIGYTSSFDDGGTPSTQLFTFQMPILGINSAVGLNITNDQAGPQRNQELQASYNYRFKLGGDRTLALGVRGGVLVKTLDFDKLRANDPDDPLIGSGKVSQTRPDFAAGLYYSTAAYYVGASLIHINGAKYSFEQALASNQAQQTVFANAGYHYQLNDEVQLNPTAILKSDLNTFSVEASLLALWREFIWVGAGWRQGDGVPVFAGVNWSRLRLGVSYDVILNGVDAKSPGSFSVLLSYALPPLKPNKRIPVRTPRFRF
ncbi:MAG: type IX secretion system membrane protein PorP/SprF [Siphonobacter sp.]